MNQGISEYIRTQISQGIAKELIIRDVMDKFDRPRKAASIDYYKAVHRPPLGQKPAAPAVTPVKPPKPVFTQKHGLSLSDLRKQYSVPFIVEQGLADLKKGVFLTEREFIDSLQMKDPNGVKSVLERNEYDKYRGKARGGPMYYSHPDSIQEAKNEILLR